VKICPVGKEMLLPADEEANCHMLAPAPASPRCAAYCADVRSGERAKNPGYQFRAGLADQWVWAHHPHAALRRRISSRIYRVPVTLPLHQGDRREPEKSFRWADVYPGPGRRNGEENLQLIEDPKTHRLHVWPQGHGARHRRSHDRRCHRPRGWIGSVPPSPAQEG